MNILQSLAATAALALAGLTAVPAAAEGLIDDIRERGTLRIGMSTFVPWAMRDKAGNLIGFEIDVAKKLAEDMGVTAEFVPTAWSGIVPALLAGKFDLVISGLTVTPERSATVDFTIPYAHSGQQLAANTALAGNLKTLEDYNTPDVTLTCRRGATPCQTAQEMFPLATLLQFDDDAQAYQEVLNGNAHAVASSSPKPAFFVEEHADRMFLPFEGKFLTEGNEAMALRKDNADATAFFSDWIETNEANGWLAKTHAFWFDGQTAWMDQVADEQ